jgi:hypothetical protein
VIVQSRNRLEFDHAPILIHEDLKNQNLFLKKKRVNIKPIFSLNQIQAVSILEETYLNIFKVKSKVVLTCIAFELPAKMKIMYHEHTIAHDRLNNITIRYPTRFPCKPNDYGEHDVIQYDGLNDSLNAYVPMDPFLSNESKKFIWKGHKS